MKLSSTAFQEGELIPVIHTCDGQDRSPQLRWDDVPAGVKSFVLIMDDPDAPMGTWDHWVVFNIPANVREFSENMPLPSSAQYGLNSWKEQNYLGPCPPDKLHRYFFKLYALDIELHFIHTPDKAAVEFAMQKHILQETVLMGRYDRPR